MIRRSFWPLFISLSISFSAGAQDAKLIEQAKKEGGKADRLWLVGVIYCRAHCRSVSRRKPASQ